MRRAISKSISMLFASFASRCLEAWDSSSRGLIPHRGLDRGSAHRGSYCHVLVCHGVHQGEIVDPPKKQKQKQTNKQKTKNKNKRQTNKKPGFLQNIINKKKSLDCEDQMYIMRTLGAPDDFGSVMQKK